MKIFPFLKKDKTRAESSKEYLPENAAFMSGLLDLIDSAGRSISVSDATGIAAVYACRAAISESIAMLPIFMIEQIGDSVKRLNSGDHELLDLLRDAPNPVMDSFTFFEKMQNDLLDHGDAFSFIEKDRSSTIKNLWPLQADKMDVKSKGGAVSYLYRDGDGERREYQAHEIFHIKFKSRDGIRGVSPLEDAGASFNYARSLLDFGNSYFKNGTFLGGILEPSFDIKTKEDRERIVTEWAKYQGSRRANKIALLEKGMKYTQLQPNVKDAEISEARTFSVVDIARIYRCPPHMIQELSQGASYASIEQQAIAFVQYTILPWVTRWERAIRRWLLFPFEDSRNYHVKFNISALIRGDLASRTTAIVQQLQYGLLTLNEARRILDQDAVSDKMADEVLISHNLRPLADLGKEENPQSDPAVKETKKDETPKDQDARTLEARFTPLFNDLMGRIFRRAAAVWESEEKRGADDAKIAIVLTELNGVFVETFSSAAEAVRSGSSAILPGFWSELSETFIKFRKIAGVSEMRASIDQSSKDAALILLKKVINYASK